jgi:hypothetical protein
MFGGRSRSWSLSDCRSLSFYSTWAAFQGTHYFFGNCISPFYSPELFGDSPHSWFGAKPAWWPTWLLFSPALLVLWAPGGFRSLVTIIAARTTKRFGRTRRPALSGEPRKTYLGERSFPLIMQNVHRYFLYLALIFIVILTIDVWKALWFVDPATNKNSFGISVGTIVSRNQCDSAERLYFWVHSLRHLAGGFLDQFSKSPGCLPRLRVCELFKSSPHALGMDELVLGRFHRSLCRLCSMGIWHDWRIV